MIPPRLIRTVPSETTDEVEQFWSAALTVTGWEGVTYRDPIEANRFPITSPHWERCTSGAQLAGLVRLEALWNLGGVYIDSDVEIYRPLTPLAGATIFAGWEDDRTIPDAVIGSEAGHPIIAECIEKAIDRLDQGAWASGPGVTTETFQNRPEVLLLPPGSFYPYHYTEKRRKRDAPHKMLQPWAFGAHHWHHSWDGT